MQGVLVVGVVSAWGVEEGVVVASTVVRGEK